MTCLGGRDGDKVLWVKEGYDKNKDMLVNLEEENSVYYMCEIGDGHNVIFAYTECLHIIHFLHTSPIIIMYTSTLQYTILTSILHLLLFEVYSLSPVLANALILSYLPCSLSALASTVPRHSYLCFISSICIISSSFLLYLLFLVFLVSPLPLLFLLFFLILLSFILLRYNDSKV